VNFTDNFLRLKEYLKQAECLQAVTFTGMLTGKLKSAALAAADLYVAPSYSEGFSISILEGLGSGLPCIITTNCNFPEAAEAKVAYVVQATTQNITEALIKCVSQPLEAKEMGDRAQKFVFEHYTWEKIAFKLVEVYQQILLNQQLEMNPKH